MYVSQQPSVQHSVRFKKNCFNAGTAICLAGLHVLNAAFLVLFKIYIN